MKKSTNSSACAPRGAGLDLAISSITKQFGSGSIMRLGSNVAMNVSAISSGNIKIDELIGVGGFPRGRIMEVFGPESSGKTTLCLMAIAAAQRDGGVVAFIDVEHSLDPAWAKLCGVDIDALLVSQPDSGEDALNITETLVRSNAVDAIVLDSVAALVTKAELDGQMGDATMGATARLMSQAMRRLTAAVSKSQCTLIFTNQIREKIGVMFGSPETTPGGRALRFFSSVRIDVRRKDTLKGPDGAAIGNLIKLKTVKNKVAPPFAEIEVEILYDRGICRFGALIDLAIEHKFLEKKGAWIAFNGELVGQGREAARSALQTSSELFDKLDKLVRDHLASSRTIEAVIERDDANAPTTEVPPAPTEELALAEASG